MAGAGFKTFNTGDVLTSSDVNQYLMQQTVMVFDDASARSTALPTPSEGMFSYLKDTNLTYRYDGSAWLSDAGTTSPLTTKGDVWGYSTTDARIPVGANGTVLTADSAETLGVKWAAPSSGSMTLLSTTSLSGSSTSVSITGTGYQGLKIFVYDYDVSTANQLFIRLNSDSGNNYRYVGHRILGNNFYDEYSDTTSRLRFPGTANTTQTDSIVMVEIYNSEQTSAYKLGRWLFDEKDNGVGTPRDTAEFMFSYLSTSAITNFSIHCNAAETFSAGTILVYGVK